MLFIFENDEGAEFSFVCDRYEAWDFLTRRLGWRDLTALQALRRLAEGATNTIVTEKYRITTMPEDNHIA